MDNHSKIVNALLALLTRKNDDAFVIIKQLPTKKFVQFAGSITTPLLLDLPSQTLSEIEFYRAVKLFQQMGIEGSEYDLLDQPDGEVIGQQFTFNVVCNSAASGANLAEKIFTTVYEFPIDCDIDLIEN
ncbi:hypothetical protein Lepto7376_1823 [[Leptolyngbya] sp. PCC 7376]|uniref:hypothetical protein n=1 Tax=[Leptolyngbya] sp. PCC 7376 TaxID=111781 RepID=UPI00029ECA17|nr:hypothetical protein [[Leptolyngbya] sp. PCC 7376]AFY38151.1 hypothetical protein Lepto7376_1823 [[Leptolyngbya] sp. PCC 7376]